MTSPTILSSNTTFEGRFHIERCIGAGGMGEVYLARDNMLDRNVAIKLILNGENSARFERECKIMSAIQSNYLPQIYSWGVAKSQHPYIAMEFVVGETLASLLQAGSPISSERLCEICIPLCEALTAIHSCGIVHRDLKPSNIMIESTPCSSVKLMDFGIAHLSEQQLTRTNEVIGSLGYLSPEHFTPRELDARSDIFSLGCVMYECLTGELPFDSASPAAFMVNSRQKLLRSFPKEVDNNIALAIVKCLERDPKKRFQSAAELLNAISQSNLLDTGISTRLPASERASATSRRFKLLAALTAGFLLLVVGISVSSHSQKKQLPPTKAPHRHVGDPVSTLHIMVDNRSIENAREVLKILESKDQSWLFDKGGQFIEDLQNLGILATQAKDIEIADRAFALALKSIRKDANGLQIYRQTLFRQLVSYKNAGYFSRATHASKEFLALKELQSVEEFHAKGILAECYWRQRQYAESKALYAVLFPEPIAPPRTYLTDDERADDLSIVLCYCHLLSLLNERADIRDQLLRSRMNELRALLEKRRTELHPGAATLLCSYGMLANAVRGPRLEHDQRQLAELFETGRKKFLHRDQELTLLTYQGVFTRPFDEGKSRSLLLEAVKLARESKNLVDLRIAVTTLHGLQMLSKRDNKELTDEVCRNARFEKNLPATQWFVILYQQAVANEDCGELKQFEASAKEAVQFCSKVTFTGGLDQRLIAHQLRRLTQLARKHKLNDLIRDCEREVDHVSSSRTRS